MRRQERDELIENPLFGYDVALSACRAALLFVRRAISSIEILAEPGRGPVVDPALSIRLLGQVFKGARSHLRLLAETCANGGPDLRAAARGDGLCDRTRSRRLGALIAWIDEIHQFSRVESADDELPFFVDAVHLDAYAETLDSMDWKTTREGGRAYYVCLARRAIAICRSDGSRDGGAESASGGVTPMTLRE
jgi:hypothetical protein